MDFHPSRTLRFFTTFLLVTFGTILIGQDNCVDANHTYDLTCDLTSFEAGAFSGPYMPDSEAQGCMVGQPGGWHTFDVEPGIQSFEFETSNDVNVFYGDCSNLVLAAESCGSDIFEVDVVPGNYTFYVLFLEDEYFLVDAMINEAANQECVDAEFVPSNSSSVAELICATPTAGSECGGDHSVWFEYHINDDGTDLQIFLEASDGDTWSAMYLEDCNTPVAPFSGECTFDVFYECLDAGTYFIEVSGIDGAASPVYPIFMETPSPAENDNCDSPLIIDTNIGCSFGGEWGAFEDNYCPDPEITTSCFDEGEWFLFAISEDVPYFNIEGEEFEIFEGEGCVDLISFGSCASIQITNYDYTVYKVLVGQNGYFYIETPNSPVNTECDLSSPVPSGPITLCCNVQQWFSIPLMSDGVEIELEGDLLGTDMITVFSDECNEELFTGSAIDFPQTFSNCGEYLILSVESGSCIEIVVNTTPLYPGEEVAYTCDDAIYIETLVSGGDIECFTSDNSYGCENTCNGMNSAWFEVETDALANAINVELFSSLNLVYNIYEGDCGNLIASCLSDYEYSFPALPEESYFIQVATVGGTGIIELCASASSASVSGGICDYDPEEDLILIDSLTYTYNDTDGVVHNLHKFDYAHCDSICLSMTVHTNGIPWAGSGNLEWDEECISGPNTCAGDIDNPSAGPCNNCWDFLAARLVMDDSIYYQNVLGDTINEPLTATWTTGIIATPAVSIDSGYVDMFSQAWAQNEFLTYEGLTLICYTGTSIDRDNDGVTEDQDCNDYNPNIYPGNIEICDGLDNDCDQMVDEGFNSITYYQDADNDGYGSGNNSITDCIQPQGYVPNNTDCNDTDPNINPGAIEICDGLDNDCDLQVDEGFNAVTYFQDADNDGYGNGNNTITDCVQPQGYVPDSTDCNDTDPNINPGAIEIINNNVDENCDGVIEVIDNDGDGFNSDDDCNDNDPNNFPGNTESCDSMDNDCDQQIDEGVVFVNYYADNDGDGYGDISESVSDCIQPSGYVTNNIDCNDADPNINPGASEISNNDIDENCDGIIEATDNDGDGFNSDDDCDDNNPSVFPGNTESCDGIDNDCDMLIDEDFTLVAYYVDNDNDGYGDGNSSVTACSQPSGYVNNNSDCDDSNDSINPGATEIINNNVDENCDGIIEIIDADGDGFNSSDDCDDNDPNNYPGNTELCDGRDNDCDMQIDEGLTLITYYPDADGDGFGDFSSSVTDCVPPTGYVTNNTDCDDTDPNNFPGNTESCDEVDNNCNGIIDEGVVFIDYYPDFDNDGYGSSVGAAITDCRQPSGYVQDNTDCDDNNAAVNPGALEIANNDLDENCDGNAEVIDEDEDGYNSDEDCDDADPNNYPGNTEICDGRDNDCNSEIDDGLTFLDYYADADGDGYGNMEVTVSDCIQPADYVTNDLDCDDTNATINPDAEELPANGIDENCDGEDDPSAVHDLNGVSISIFPNPVNDILYLESTIRDLRYEIYTLEGLRIISGKLKHNKIDLSSQTPGIYILMISEIGSATQIVERILKL